MGAAHYIGHAPAIPKLFQSAWYDTGDDIGDMTDRTRFLAKALALPDVGKAIAN